MKKLLIMLTLLGSLSAMASTVKVSHGEKLELLNSLVGDSFVYSGKDSGLRIDEAKKLIVVAMSGAEEDSSRSEIQKFVCTKKSDKSVKCSFLMMLESDTTDSDSGFDTIYKYEFNAFDDMTIYNLKTKLIAG